MTAPRTRARRTSDAIAEARGQGALPPIQPVAKPILCGPYTEPDRHWVYDTRTGAASQAEGRRPASYWYQSERTGSAQLALGFQAEEERDDLPLVNALRDDVRRWGAQGYEGATAVSKQLLRHWAREDRARRLFFCQREAVETVVYLNEILAAGRKLRWTPKLPPDDYRRLVAGEPVAFEAEACIGRHATLADRPPCAAW